jgi:fucose 4-O-acetylase-like acetyltransferase
VKTNASTRLGWVDTTRGLGIALMFYGHVLQRGLAANNASAAEQIRFIYSFHMPVFFLLAGGFFRRPATAWWRRVPQLLQRRLVPFLFFGVALAPLWIHAEEHPSFGHLAASYLRGDPELNWVTWFLACLFTCEVLALPWLGRLGGPLRTLAVGLALTIGGVWLCNADALHSILEPWFRGEAGVGLGLYTIGFVVIPHVSRFGGRRLVAAIVFAVSMAIVLATYGYNTAAGESVMMAGARQGDAFWFLFTALAGSAALLALGIALSGVRWLEAAGRHSLALLGLNGFFFHYGNELVAKRWPIPDSHGWIVLDVSLVALLSLLACAPFVYLLDRYLPMMIGKPGPSRPPRAARGSVALEVARDP